MYRVQINPEIPLEGVCDYLHSLGLDYYTKDHSVVVRKGCAGLVDAYQNGYLDAKRNFFPKVVST